MTVKDRIMEFCRTNGIRPGRFERECGLSNAYLSKLKHEPSRDKLGKILNRYPELNKNWLLTGEGEMLRTVPYPTLDSNGDQHINDNVFSADHAVSYNDVIIPRDAWEVIRNQAASLRERDEQMNQLISMLRKQIDGKK